MLTYSKVNNLDEGMRRDFISFINFVNM